MRWLVRCAARCAWLATSEKKKSPNYREINAGMGRRGLGRFTISRYREIGISGQRRLRTKFPGSMYLFKCELLFSQNQISGQHIPLLMRTYLSEAEMQSTSWFSPKEEPKFRGAPPAKNHHNSNDCLIIQEFLAKEAIFLQKIASTWCCAAKMWMQAVKEAKFRLHALQTMGTSSLLQLSDSLLLAFFYSPT